MVSVRPAPGGGGGTETRATADTAAWSIAPSPEERAMRAPLIAPDAETVKRTETRPSKPRPFRLRRERATRA